MKFGVMRDDCDDVVLIVEADSEDQIAGILAEKLDVEIDMSGVRILEVEELNEIGG